MQRLSSYVRNAFQEKITLTFFFFIFLNQCPCFLNLEALARTADTFSIDISSDRPLIERAVELTTITLLSRNDTTPDVPDMLGIIEGDTHALIGVEKAYALLQ